MKSMAQMQMDLFERCRQERAKNGTSYPRCVMVGMGIVRAVYSAEEEKRVLAEDAQMWMINCVVAVVVLIGLLIWFL